MSLVIIIIIIIIVVVLILQLTHTASSLFLSDNISHHNRTTKASLIKSDQQYCQTKCGSFDEIRFPFYLGNATRPCLSDAFRLSCVNSSSLFLKIASDSYRVLRFFPDGILVDFPTCHRYNDLRSFPFSGNEYFGISSDNVLDLYDCEDSSVCKLASECERVVLPPSPGCGGGGYPSSCCYPLSDPSAWRAGTMSFSHFSKEYGCRGFSSWVSLSEAAGSKIIGERGVKLEWAVPNPTTNESSSSSSSSSMICVTNADIINATSVPSGIRCQCQYGFVGDGFAAGSGCIKSCWKDGKEAYGDDCYRNSHGRKKATIVAGIITSVFAAITLSALFCVLKRRMMLSSSHTHQQRSSFMSEKACRARLFAYHELEEATKGFADEQKIVDGSMATLYAGVLGEGLHVGVQRVLFCENERDFIRILFRVEALSAVSHKNMARILGWSIDSGHAPIVVYEYPDQNDNLEQHLRRARHQQTPLDWFKRLNIAVETANVLGFLHHEISPPIFHHDLRPGYIFLDTDFSVRLAGFGMHPRAGCEQETSTRRNYRYLDNDVCSLGVVLLRIITGNTSADFCSKTALHKIKSGKLEEMVDPSLYYHEQPPFRKEQIETTADLAARCLLFGADGKLRMADVARELMHIKKDGLDRSRSSLRGHSPVALEETFSNSSLLQMISISPDSSIYLPA